MVIVRRELPGDKERIRNVITTAFSDSEFGDNGEAGLVDALREACPEYLSLVASVDERIVGHLLLTKVTASSIYGRSDGLGLAPVSVLPEFQGQGIGTKLISEAFHNFVSPHSSFTVVLGHPEFYQRFGFVLASKFGLLHGFKGIPQDMFLIRTEFPEKLTQIGHGIVTYHELFGPQHTSDG